MKMIATTFKDTFKAISKIHIKLGNDILTLLYSQSIQPIMSYICLFKINLKRNTKIHNDTYKSFV